MATLGEGGGFCSPVTNPLSPHEPHHLNDSHTNSVIRILSSTHNNNHHHHNLEQFSHTANNGHHHHHNVSTNNMSPLSLHPPSSLSYPPHTPSVTSSLDEGGNRSKSISVSSIEQPENGNDNSTSTSAFSLNERNTQNNNNIQSNDNVGDDKVGPVETGGGEPSPKYISL